MLPQTYAPGYVTARKSGNMYRLYYTGTQNEVFPGELFRTAGDARMYYRVQIVKQQQHSEAAYVRSYVQPGLLADADGAPLFSMQEG